MKNNEWLEERKNYIGGSDCAAILGLNRYKSPLVVYMEKIGELPYKEPTRRMEMGNRLEPMIAEDFCKETGLKVRNVNMVLKHHKYDFIKANIDRKITNMNEGLECKTTDIYNLKEWEDDAPIEYIAQCMHYMAVTGFKKWWLACWVGFGHFVYYELNYDVELIDKIIKAEVKFWNENILKKIPPEITYQDTDLLNDLYKGDLEPIELIDQKENIIKYLEIDKQIKTLTKEHELYKNKLKEQLGDHESGKEDNYIINWKSQKQIRLDTKLLKEEQPHIYSNYSKELNLRKFGIKEIKNNER